MMNMENNCRLKVRVDNLMSEAKKQIPLASLADSDSVPEKSLVQLAIQSKNIDQRIALSELYRIGYFGHHDVVRGYTWILIAWESENLSYDEKFELAEIQQYYEYFLAPEEIEKSTKIFNEILPKNAATSFTIGKPFNDRWWGWEDDPIPIRPGSKIFNMSFVKWLEDGGYIDTEIAEILARCASSD